jgi:hypothetical protein
MSPIPWRTRLLLAALSAGLIVGCAQRQEGETTAPPPAAGTGAPNSMGSPGPPGPPGGPAGAPGGAPSMAQGAGAAEAAAQAHPDLAKKVSDLKAAYDKNPRDAATKKQLAAAAYTYGHTVMTDEQLSPRVKYRAALKQFRLALQVDPSHAKASQEKKMIEDIYRQMGRPIPE